jgi:hypothetical protein
MIPFKVQLKCLFCNSTMLIFGCDNEDCKNFNMNFNINQIKPKNNQFEYPDEFKQLNELDKEVEQTVLNYKKK